MARRQRCPGRWHLSTMNDSFELVELREIPIEQAVEEIRELMSDGEERYWSDIADELQLDIQLVIKACYILEDEGVLGEA